MPTATETHLETDRRWTYDELLAQLPESNQSSELWDGELIMSPSPTPAHQTVVLALARLLEDFVTSRQLGRVFISPLDVIFSPTRAVQPDIIFVATASNSIIRDRIRGVPNLIVEIISEGSWRRDRVDKKALYEQVSVPEYWIVDPESETIEVFTLVRGAYELHVKAVATEHANSKLLEGFSVRFRDLVR